MRNPFWTFFAAIPAFLIAASTAQAQLVLNVDSTLKLFWFTGSDSGVTGSSGNSGIISWSLGSSDNTAHAFTPSALITSTSTHNTGFLRVADFSGYEVRVEIYNAPALTAVTLTGRGTSFTYDYSGFGAFEKSVLETPATLALVTGAGQASGFASMSVTLSSIPEPSTYAAMAGALIFGGAISLRRWRSARR